LYGATWRPKLMSQVIKSGDTVAIGGTSFLWGKTITYRRSTALTGVQLGVLGQAGDCSTDYSYKNAIIPMRGSKAQVLDVGVYTAEVSLGTPAQTFTVQLDTGSGELLLLKAGCGKFGPECFNVARFQDDRVMVIVRSPYDEGSPCQGEADAIINYEACKGKDFCCSIHTSPQGPTPAECTQGVTASLEDFENFAYGELQANHSCAPTRAECGDLRVYTPPASSPIPAASWVHPPLDEPLPPVVCEGSPNDKSKGLSTTAIAVIICVSVAVIGVLMSGGFIFIRKRRLTANVPQAREAMVP